MALGYGMIYDDLDNATGGYGQAIDLYTQLGIAVGPTVTPTAYGAVVGESTVTAGAVALQYGIVSQTTGEITWQSPGEPVTVPAHSAAAVAGTSVEGATHVRMVVTTPVVGGKATSVVMH